MEMQSSICGHTSNNKKNQAIYIKYQGFSILKFPFQILKHIFTDYIFPGDLQLYIRKPLSHVSLPWKPSKTTTLHPPKS